jgi:hypothetical protein
MLGGRIVYAEGGNGDSDSDLSWMTFSTRSTHTSAAPSSPACAMDAKLKRGWQRREASAPKWAAVRPSGTEPIRSRTSL